MKKGNYQIPFDKDGNQQHFPEPWYVGKYPNHKAVGPDWRDNTEFSDVLTFQGFRRGRSAAYAVFKRLDGTEATMFLADLEPAMACMDGGVLQGRFIFTKRGQNYGVQFVGATA